MSLNMRIFVGVDCDQQQMTMGFIGSQGLLRALSTTKSPLPDQIDRFGERVYGMIRGLRGDVNLRMKNFYGIGIGILGSYVNDFRPRIEKQLKELTKIPFYIEDRDLLVMQGKTWLVPRINPLTLDINGVYGAAKLAIECTKKNML